MRIIYEEGLSGRTVVDGTGRAVGSVVAALVDIGEWRIDGLRVKLRREVAETLGAPHGVFRPAYVDVPIDEVQGVADAVVLRRRIDLLYQREEGRPAEPPPP